MMLTDLSIVFLLKLLTEEEEKGKKKKANQQTTTSWVFTFSRSLSYIQSKSHSLPFCNTVDLYITF